MQAHAAAGNPAEALRVYERCRRFLSEELGVYPSPETEAVYLEILRSPSSTSADADRRGEETSRDDLPPAANDAPPRRRRRRLVAVVAGALVVAAGATAAALALTRGNDPPPKVLPMSLVRLDPKTFEPTKVVPIGPRADFVFASHEYVWFTRGILRFKDDVGIRNAGDRGLWRYDPATDDLELVPGVAPCGIAPDPSGDMWVLNCWGSGQGTTVQRINRRTLHSKPTFSVAAGGFIRGLTYGDGYLWLTGKGAQVIRLNPRTGRKHAFKTPYPPSGLLWSHDALWIPAWGGEYRPSELLWRMPVETERPVQYPYAVSWSSVFPIAQGDWVWLGEWQGAWVIRVPADGKGPPRYTSLQVKTTGPVSVTGLAAGDGAVWATLPDDKAVFQIDLGTGKAKRIPLPYSPWGVDVADDGGIWVTVRPRAA